MIGMPIEVQDAFLFRDEAKLSATGGLTLESDGYLAGDLQITATDPERIAELVRPFYPPASAVPQAFQGALTGFGQKTTLNGRPAVTAKFTFREGAIRIGFVPIAQMVPFF